MTTVQLTLAKPALYRVDFFKGGNLFSVHEWTDRSKVRDVLKASGLKLQKNKSPRVQWWPLVVGETRHFEIENPAAWFWAE